MQRLKLFILLSAVLLAVSACLALSVGYRLNDRLARLRAQALAREVADALGRIPASQIVELEQCGNVFSGCGYVVAFTSPEAYAAMNERVLALNQLNLTVKLPYGYYTTDHLLDTRGELSRAVVRGQLTVTPTGTPHGPAGTDWSLQNERGETVCTTWLYFTKDTEVTYLFDGNPLPNANLVRVYAEAYPHQ